MWVQPAGLLIMLGGRDEHLHFIGRESEGQRGCLELLPLWKRGADLLYPCVHQALAVGCPRD